MSCYKDLLSEIEALRDQLSEVLLAAEAVREIAQSGEVISAKDVLLQLSGVGTGHRDYADTKLRRRIP